MEKSATRFAWRWAGAAEAGSLEEPGSLQERRILKQLVGFRAVRTGEAF